MYDTKKIPPAVAKILKASLSRIRHIILFRGICATLAVFIASVLAIMAIDAMVTIYSNWVRWMLWCGVVSGTGSVAWFALIKPLRRKISLSDVALLIERNHPELEERLSTVVELAEEGRGGEVWSKELVNEITKRAITDATKVSPKKEFTSRTIKPRFIVAAAAVLVLLGLFAAFPTATARLVARALMPAAEVDNIYASSLKVAPGDQVLLAGSSFKVSLAVNGGFPSKAFVRTSVNGRSEAVERMVRMTEEEAKGPIFYEFDYPSVHESFTYRVNCGSALTKAYSVKVVPTPTFVDRKIRIEHPAYTERNPTEYTNSAEVVAVPGSRVVISFRKPREDITGYIKIPGERILEAEPVDENGLAFAFDVGKDMDGMWSAMAQDSNGFSNQVVSSAVTVAKDTPPSVELTVPETAEIKLPRSGVLPVEFKAKDDFKVAKAVLEIAVGTADYKDLREFELSQGQDGYVVGSEMVSILALGSRLGKSAAFQVRVRVEDNLPEELGGPGVTRSSSVLVELQTKGQNGSDGGKSLGRQELQKQIEETKKESEDIRRTLETAMRHMENARNGYRHTNNPWNLNDAKKNHDLCKTHISNAEGLFADFIQNLLDTRLSTGAEILRPVMDRHLVPVRQEVEDIYLVDISSRYGPACKCYDHFKELMKAYDEALKKYQILTKTAEDMQKLEDLKEQQEALAEAAEKGEMSPQELGDAEKQLMDEMQRELQDDMQRSLDKEIEKAEKIAKRMDELAQKQKDIKEKMSGDEQKNSENQLARELENLVRETDKLLQDVEKQTGIPELDESRTAEPLESTKWSQEDATDSAKDAAKNLGEQKNEEAKANMDEVSEALSQAKEQLTEAQNRMKQANERFANEAKEMQELMNKINEAMQAAMEAAKAELGNQQMSQEQMEQMAQQAAEQMAGQEKMSPEQRKAMLEAMKESLANMTPEQAKAMADAMKESMKQAMEQMKQEFGKLSPEELKAKLGEIAKQAAQEMQQQQQQSQSQQPQSPEMQQMQQKFESAAEMMKQQMQQMMQQQNMPQEQFQQQQMQQPQNPMQQQMQQMQQNQQNQQQQQDQQQQQQEQQQSSQSQQENQQHQQSQSQTSNVREALGEDDGVDWFRMKSSSSSGAEADPMDDVPSEYRGLVRDYFKALNQGGKK